MSNFLSDDVLNKRSQDLSKYYRLNGAIYISKIEKFLENKNFFLKNNVSAYIIDKKDSIDINDRFYFELTKFILQQNYSIKNSLKK